VLRSKFFIFVSLNKGNLPPDCRNNELEDIFYKYGRIRYVDIKKSRGPPFAFVEFDDPLDAEDAVRGRDGYNFDGYRLKVFKDGTGVCEFIRYDDMKYAVKHLDDTKFRSHEVCWNFLLCFSF